MDPVIERAQERAGDLLKIVRGFANPVTVMHGIPVRLYMNCLRDDAVKLLKQIDGESDGQESQA
jgi:hypothetical protein